MTWLRRLRTRIVRPFVMSTVIGQEKPADVPANPAVDAVAAPDGPRPPVRLVLPAAAGRQPQGKHPPLIPERPPAAAGAGPGGTRQGAVAAGAGGYSAEQPAWGPQAFLDEAGRARLGRGLARPRP